MCEKSIPSSSSTHESRRRATATYADDTGDMEEEKYAEEDDCDAPTDESIQPPQPLTLTPYQQLLSSQNVVNGSFNPEFLSAFGISLTEIPADITSLTTDPDLQY